MDNDLNKIKFTRSQDEPYPMHIGQPVELILGHISMVGFYRGLSTNEDLVLQPSITYQTINGHNRDSEQRRISVWNVRPTLICYRACSGMMPIDKYYIERRVEESKKFISYQEDYSI